MGTLHTAGLLQLCLAIWAHLQPFIVTFMAGSIIFYHFLLQFSQSPYVMYMQYVCMWCPCSASFCSLLLFFTGFQQCFHFQWEVMQDRAAPNPAGCIFGNPFTHWRLWPCSLTLHGAVRPHYALRESHILWLERQLQNKGRDTTEVIMDGKQRYTFFL